MSTFVVASVEPEASPPMTPPRPERAAVVGDDAHGVVDRVLLAVEAHELLAGLAEAGAHGAHQLVGVIDVQRPAAVRRCSW